MVTTLIITFITLSSMLLRIVTSLMAWKQDELADNEIRHTGHLTHYTSRWTLIKLIITIIRLTLHLMFVVALGYHPHYHYHPHTPHDEHNVQSS